jgi:hypothetical protein
VPADQASVFLFTSTTPGDGGLQAIDVQQSTASGGFLLWIAESGGLMGGYSSPSGTFIGPSHNPGTDAGVIDANFSGFGQLHVQIADRDHFVIYNNSLANGNPYTGTGTVWILGTA